jgi:hypothetical protein
MGWAMRYAGIRLNDLARIEAMLRRAASVNTKDTAA